MFKMKSQVMIKAKDDINKGMKVQPSLDAHNITTLFKILLVFDVLSVFIYTIVDVTANNERLNREL
ncbi:hypothetical protein GQX74_010113 [Glossina fuscipes]|nr:hypothetical protein GQX74_010113 [Glossina fuscipes]